jgi:O-antigen/teichoic acid export membrane protein
MSVARHTAYNLVGAIVPLAVTLVATPFYISAIGVARYGIIAIFWTLLNSLSFMSFGIGPAVAKKIASMAGDSARDRSQLVWTALMLAVCLSAIAALLIFAVADIYFKRLASTPSALRTEVADAAPWLAAAIPLILISNVLTGALQGRQHFGWLNSIQVTTAAAAALVPLTIASLFIPYLPYLVLGIVAVYLASLLVQLVIVARVLPLSSPGMPSSRTAAEIASYGGWLTVSLLVGMVLTQWDRFAIGAMIGASAVTVYQVPFALVSQLLVIPISMTSAAFPRLASSNEDDAHALGGRAIEFLNVIISPAAMLLLLGIGPFLLFWVGRQLSDLTLSVGYVLVCGMWANCLARVPLALLLARGRTKALALLHIAQVIPYALLLYVSLKMAGVTGAAFAWSIRSAVDAVLIFVIAGIRPPNLRPLVVAGLVICMIVTVSLSLPLDSPVRWVLGCAMAMAACFVIWRERPADVSLDRLLKPLQRFIPFGRGLT